MRNLSNILLYETMLIYEGMVDSMIYKIKDEDLKRKWQAIFDKAKQIFSNRMDYVNWFFDKTFSVSSYSSVEDADSILDWFKEFYDLNIQSINKISIIKYDNIIDVFNDMGDAKKLYFEKLYKDVILLDKIEGATELLVCSDLNFIWFDLHTTSCEEEHVAMGHCGQDTSGDTLWSLREKIFVGGKLVGYEPHVTATYHEDDKRLSQVKGRENVKPVEKYHKFIKELVYAGLVKDFGGGAYKPENDFGWDDFSISEIKEIIDDRTRNTEEVGGFLLNMCLENNLFDLLSKSYLNEDELNDIFVDSCEKNNKEYIEFIIDYSKKHKLSLDKDIALLHASRYSNFSVVKLLIEEGANIHVKNGLPLMYAVVSGNISTVEFLLENGADIHAQKEMALFRAVISGNKRMMKFLIDNGANVDDIW